MPQRAATPQQQEEGGGGLSAKADVIRPAGHKSKRGRRRHFFELEHAQEAILALYPRALPIIVPYSRALAVGEVRMSDLHRRVNKLLRKRGKPEVSRQTVMRALATLREANR
jgi:hypothetical protein